jgi:hypothetical protein
MSKHTFKTELRAMGLEPWGMKFNFGRYWVHIPSGRQIAIADTAQSTAQARAAAVLSIRNHMERNNFSA